MRDAAEAIVARLVGGLEPDLSALASELADDLELRCGEVEELLDYLKSSGHDLDELIAIAEFADTHGADEELLRLAGLADPARRAKELGLTEITEELLEEARAAPRQYRARMEELKRTRPGEMSVARLDGCLQAGELLRRGGEVAALLSIYYEADLVLNALERYVGEAVSAYDEIVQQEIDRARDR